MSAPEELLMLHIRAAKLPMPEREHKFHPTRRWRFDLAYPARSLAIEVEGGVYSGGRHTRGKGFTDDCEKYNQAVLLGWRVLRFTTAMIKSGAAIETIERAIETLRNKNLTSS